MKPGIGGKHIKGPVWNLKRVQSLVRSGHFWLMRTKAFDRIAETQMIAEGGVVAAERKPGEEENVRGEPEGEIEGESEEENDA